MFRTAPIDQGEHVEHGQKNGPKADGRLSPHGQAHDAVGELRKTHGERDDRQNHTQPRCASETGAGDDADDRGRPSQEKAKLMLVT